MTNDESASELPQTPNKINVDESNLVPQVDLYLQVDKIIYHLPDSAEGKERCILHRWVEIETHNDVMYCPTCNDDLCVLFYHLFHSDVEIVNMEDSISTRIER